MPKYAGRPSPNAKKYSVSNLVQNPPVAQRVDGTHAHILAVHQFLHFVATYHGAIVATAGGRAEPGRSRTHLAPYR